MVAVVWVGHVRRGCRTTSAQDKDSSVSEGGPPNGLSGMCNCLSCSARSKQALWYVQLLQFFALQSPSNHVADAVSCGCCRRCKRVDNKAGKKQMKHLPPSGLHTSLLWKALMRFSKPCCMGMATSGTLMTL